MKKLIKRVLGSAAVTAACATALTSQALDGYRIIGNATTGILHERIADGKKVVMLWGDKNDLGYSHGWLLAEEVKFTCSDDFVKALVGGLISGNIPQLDVVLNNPTLFNTVLDLVSAACNTMMVYATQEMKDELHAIVNGAKEKMTSRGIDHGQTSYARLCMANLGFDLACSVFYPFAVDALDGNTAALRELHDNYHACDGFVINKNRTTTGGSLMGRNFMNSEVVFGNDHGFIFDINPKYGTRLTGQSFAGSVGLPVGMNSYGVSMGMDMAPAKSTNVAATGMGCLLQTRYALQYKTNLHDAIASIGSAVSRGCPWIYIMADKDNGAAVEAGATALFGGIGSGADPEYFAVRYTNTVLDGCTHPDKDKFWYIGQWETNPDYVIAANTILDPVLIVSSNADGRYESQARYNMLNRVVERELKDGKKFSLKQAKSLVNYQDCFPDGPDNLYAYDKVWSGEYNYQWNKNGTGVGGSRTAFDCLNKTMYCKYGIFSDNWVKVDWIGTPEFREKPWYEVNY